MSVVADNFFSSSLSWTNEVVPSTICSKTQKHTDTEHSLDMCLWTWIYDIHTMTWLIELWVRKRLFLHLWNTSWYGLPIKCNCIIYGYSDSASHLHVLLQNFCGIEVYDSIAIWMNEHTGNICICLEFVKPNVCPYHFNKMKIILRVHCLNDRSLPNHLFGIRSISSNILLIFDRTWKMAITPRRTTFRYPMKHRLLDEHGICLF